MSTFGLDAQRILAAVRIDPKRLQELYGADAEKTAQSLFTDGGFLMPIRLLAGSRHICTTFPIRPNAP